MKLTKKQWSRLLETLADLEHKQWISWTSWLVENEELPKELVIKWKRSWLPYRELSEKQKDKDRIWARSVIRLLKRYVQTGHYKKHLKNVSSKNHKF